MDNNKIISYKIQVVGDGASGKSAFVIHLIKQNFVEEYDPTINDSYMKYLNVDGEFAILDVLDTAGQDEYAAMVEQYMVDGDGFLLVYSINSRDSFLKARENTLSILRVKDVEKFPIILVGNNCELRDSQRKVTFEEGEDLAINLGISFFEGSSKTGVNVEESFSQLVREIRTYRSKWTTEMDIDKLIEEAEGTTHLELCAWGLKKVPRSLCYDLFPDLVYLDLSANKLRSLPTEFGTWFPSLKTLNLSSNLFFEFPSEELRGLKSLEFLNLRNNYLTLVRDVDLMGLGLNKLTRLGLQRNPLKEKVECGLNEKYICLDYYSDEEEIEENSHTEIQK